MQYTITFHNIPNHWFKLLDENEQLIPLNYSSFTIAVRSAVGTPHHFSLSGAWIIFNSAPNSPNFLIDYIFNQEKRAKYIRVLCDASPNGTTVTVIRDGVQEGERRNIVRGEQQFQLY